MQARRELIEAVGERYRNGVRKEKKQILDEFVPWAAFHRKYAIRMLRGERRIEVPVSRKKSRLYATFIEAMERQGHLQLESEVRDRLITITQQPSIVCCGRFVRKQSRADEKRQ